jgi:predicted ATPase
MITRIEIDGFKSFVDFQLDVPPFLVIVGSNNGGKSNLLEAIEFVRVAVLPGSRPLFDQRRGNATELFHRDGDGLRTDRFDIAVTTGDGMKPAARLTAEAVHEPASVEVRTDVVSGALAIDPVSTASAWHFLRTDPQTIRRPTSRVDRGPIAADGSNLAAVIPHIVEIEPVVDRPRGEVDIEFVDTRGGRFRPTVVSDGTLRVLAVLAAIHDPDHPGTLLIDEIETGLHPGYQGQLLRRLQHHALEESARTSHRDDAFAGRPEPRPAGASGPRGLSQPSRLRSAATRRSERDEGLHSCPDVRPRGRARHLRHAAGGTQLPRQCSAGRSVVRYLACSLFAEGDSDLTFLVPLLLRQLEAIGASTGGFTLDRLARVPAYQAFLQDLTTALKELNFL